MSVAFDYLKIGCIVGVGAITDITYFISAYDHGLKDLDAKEWEICCFKDRQPDQSTTITCDEQYPLSYIKHFSMSADGAYTSKITTHFGGTGKIIQS